MAIGNCAVMAGRLRKAVCCSGVLFLALVALVAMIVVLPFCITPSTEQWSLPTDCCNSYLAPDLNGSGQRTAACQQCTLASGCNYQALCQSVTYRWLCDNPSGPYTNVPNTDVFFVCESTNATAQYRIVSPVLPPAAQTSCMNEATRTALTITFGAITLLVLVIFTVLLVPAVYRCTRTDEGEGRPLMA